MNRTGTRPVVLVAPNLPADRHGFFTRRGGVGAGIYHSLNCGFGSADNPDTIRRNRAMVADSLGLAGLVTLCQHHSADVVTVGPAWSGLSEGDGPKGDGLVTDRPGIGLGILSADCAPVLFVDVQAGVVGAAHAGWRGTLGGVIGATVAAMQALGARPQRIAAAIGPAIGPSSYEVGADVRDAFMAADPAHAGFFQPAAGRFHFDLPACADHALERAGIVSRYILRHDTCREEDIFFSYRRSRRRGEADYGRQISVVALPVPKAGG